MTTSDLPKVTVELWRSDAVVLFDWLMTTDLNAVPIAHPAQKQALTDLCLQLEMQTDVMEATDAQISAAQDEVAKDMGW
jgi:hypothetical protein